MERRVVQTGRSDDDMERQVRAALDHLVVRRARLGGAIILAGVALLTLADWFAGHGDSGSPAGLHAVNAGLVVVALALLSRPAAQRRPVPFTLALFVVACAVRAVTGIWHDEVVSTAIIGVAGTFAAGTLLPWGALPQAAVAAMAGAAIAVNAVAIGGAGAPLPADAAAAVAIALVVSVAISAEVHRHRVALIQDNLRRRQAEAALARLNDELEGRVAERTVQLETATRDLEGEVRERRQVEADLRRSEAVLSVLMDNTDDAIWSIDRNYDLTFLNASMRKRFREHFGAEIDPPHYGNQVPDAIVQQMTALYDRALAGERVQAELPFESEGRRRVYLVSMNPIDDNGRVTGATVFSRDITDHKRVEEQAREHQAQLAHVLRLSTMGEMAAGLAHEINQPLGAIANYAQGCVRRLDAGVVDVDKLRHAAEEIAREALRAGEVIRRLRELVRKDSPRQEAVDVNVLVREAVGIIVPETRRAGVEVHVDAAPDLPNVTCDGIQVEQVVVNLLLNAVDAMRATENGDRTLTVRTARAGADAVEVAIRDTGVGLPPSPADVFFPFFTTKPHGLGMGLSISRSIIEAHGGRLWATPNPDRGTTFRFTLPLAGAESLAPRPEEMRDSGG